MSTKKAILEIRASSEDSPEHLEFHRLQEDKSKSAFKKYQDLVIGNRCLWNLFKYEVLTFCSYCFLS